MEASMPAFFAEALISFSREKDALPKGVISSPRAYTLPDNIGTGSFAVRAEMQRCQIHKRRNVKEHLPKSAHGDTDRRIRNAYAMLTEYPAAKAELGKILRQLRHAKVLTTKLAQLLFTRQFSFPTTKHNPLA